MGELRFETYEMPAARLGSDNPLPAVRAPSRAKPSPPPEKYDASLTEEDRQYIGYGLDTGILPYGIQDDYGRALEPRGFRAAVLENEILRATFLLEMGGRLWSLVHRPSGRELLCPHPGLQLCNVAVRNAWFSGGVEWNFAVPGHTPLSCSPLFAARVTGEGGTPVLRLYEWERIRCAPYQMDFYLPDGSPVLLARIRLVNPHTVEMPMYWWSNIAVDESPDARVIVAASSFVGSDEDGVLKRLPIPLFRGVDVSYPTDLQDSVDFFCCVDPDQRPWITAVDGEGRGLVQTSTSRLRGRKLFVWGMGPGGRRWQKSLAAGGPPNIEIQAGLARTQRQCLPMPAGAQWEWLEAYGLMEADPAIAHGSDWAAARAEVEARLDRLVDCNWLEDELARTSPTADRPPDELMHRGSGWGALELRRRSFAGEAPFCSEALLFDEASLGREQEPWLALLEEGALPLLPPDSAPGAWMVQDEWRRMLEEAVAAGHGAHWLSWLHLGVMRQQAREFDGAREAYEKSLALAPSAWAYRNLAVMEKGEERLGAAADLWVKAHRMAPGVVPLILECARALLDTKRTQEAADLLDGVRGAAALHPRVRVVRAEAALDLEDLDTVERIILSGIEVTDLREGENVLTDLWFSVQERRIAAAEGVPIDEELRARVRRECVPPPEIDYRMSI